MKRYVAFAAILTIAIGKSLYGFGISFNTFAMMLLALATAELETDFTTIKREQTKGSSKLLMQSAGLMWLCETSSLQLDLMRRCLELWALSQLHQNLSVVDSALFPMDGCNELVLPYSVGQIITDFKSQEKGKIDLQFSSLLRWWIAVYDGSIQFHRSQHTPTPIQLSSD